MKQLLCVLALSFFAAQAASAATYRVDPVHSAAIFKIGHMGVSNLYGRFNQSSGTFTLNDNDSVLQSAEIEIRTTSVDTANTSRDNHIKGTDFLNAVQYPTMTFASTAVTAVENGRYEVLGNLTLHGVTKSVTLEIQQVGQGTDQQGNHRVGAEGTFTIKRSDFGMTNMLDSIGDDVTITIALEGQKQ